MTLWPGLIRCRCLPLLQQHKLLDWPPQSSSWTINWQQDLHADVHKLSINFQEPKNATHHLPWWRVLLLWPARLSNCTTTVLSGHPLCYRISWHWPSNHTVITSSLGVLEFGKQMLGYCNMTPFIIDTGTAYSYRTPLSKWQIVHKQSVGCWCDSNFTITMGVSNHTRLAEPLTSTVSWHQIESRTLLYTRLKKFWPTTGCLFFSTLDLKRRYLQIIRFCLSSLS